MNRETFEEIKEGIEEGYIGRVIIKYLEDENTQWLGETILSELLNEVYDRLSEEDEEALNKMIIDSLEEYIDDEDEESEEYE